MPSSRKLELLLVRLIKATEEQAAATRLQAQALDRLAASNEEMVDAMMQDREEQDPEAEPERDLAGRPILS